jgi:hypothetical protein
MCAFCFTFLSFFCLIFTCSATVFGVSTESMQLSYDSRGNSVPTILLLMQRHLYVQGGLQVNHLYDISAYYAISTCLVSLGFKIEFVYLGGRDFQN